MSFSTTKMNEPHTPEQHSPANPRAIILALIAAPCLMIVLGVLLGTVATDTSLYSLGFLALPVSPFLLKYALFKSNPRLRNAAVWSFRSYETSMMGLDEREKLVVDQAFRTSYKVMALLLSLALLLCLSWNTSLVHLAYHPGQVGIIYLMLGIVGLLVYLPAAIVAWKEEV